MYCKHCGKEIADDSKFCQHCGGKLDTTPSAPKVVFGQKSNEDIIATKNYESSAIKIFAKYKVYIVLYIIWVIINTLLLLQGEDKVYEKTVNDTYSYSQIGNTFKANEVFYPFTSTGYQTSYSFNAKYYDWTEFLVYCLLLPLILYALAMIWKSSNGENIKTWIKQFEATEQDNSGDTSSKLTSTNDNIEDKEDRKEEVSASITNETPTQTKYEFGVNDENNNDITRENFLEFIVDAIKIIGVILLSLLVLILSLMYLRGFYLGCVLSIASGILGFYLIKKYNRKKDDTSNESKEEKSPLYYISIILFFIILLFVCFNNGGSRLLKNINTPSSLKMEINDDHKGEVEKKSNKPKKKILRTHDLYNNDRKIFKEFDSQMKSINRQMEEIDNQMNANKTINDSYLDYYFP